ncbi:hypothetical protein [Hymenobacter negativus]|uniref:Uncharacterized protein n=1 Tax=Hymenobacter negativus TaxID=2795026 RepID=A0ABS0Q964_9BACT|nr:hypothetical protein [Hymenobacter negativus]MBH8559002.1 hypothetical protein [Hymenobacter negativus]
MPLPLLCCLLGLGSTIIIAVIGGLLSRSIRQMDEKLDTNCDAVAAIKADMKGYELLAQHLTEKNNKLEQKVDTLSKSHAEIDKFIAVQVALHKITPPL